MEIEQVFEIAKAFREAIISVPKNEFRTSLSCTEFPHGCCDDASQLLAAFLSDKGFDGSVRVHGIHGGNEGELRTHVWLSYSGLIIDITADQFEDYNEHPILVSLKSKFHDSFEIESKEPADFRVKFANDSLWLSKFTRDYENVLKRMNA